VPRRNHATGTKIIKERVKMAEIEKLDGKTMDIVEQNIEQLKELFPSVFSEGKVQFNQLEELLGNYVVEDEDHYNFTWHGKRKAGRLAQTPSTGTLRPAKDESVDWDNTENLFIEGDNLEVLKLLQKSYHRQVKMIYIDPPYNTGKEFIYPDKFQDNLDTYMKYTGQIDGEGRKYSVNSESSGRYHTSWLNMMYPRLKLARNLLRDDGVIFISIDDHEHINLKKICDEVFGEENFIASLCIINNMKGRNDKANIATAHEYLLIYQKVKFISNGVPLSEEQLKEYKHIDENGEKYALRDLRKRGRPDRREDRPNMYFPIFFNKENNSCSLNRTSDDDIEIVPLRGDKTDGRWRWGKQTVETNLDIFHPKYSKQKDRWDVQHRVYLNPTVRSEPSDEEADDDDKDIQRTSKPKSFWWGGDISTDVANREFKKLFSGLNPDYPKSPYYIEKLLHMGTSSNDIVLDFFAGYSTTAHAVMNLNATEETNRKFIMVQLPEKLSEDVEEQKDTYKYCAKNNIEPKISSVSMERIKKAKTAILDKKPDYAGDLGFKLFKLDTSNIKRWDANFDTLESDLMDAVDYLVKDRTDEDVLYELCLKLSLDLSIKIEEKTIAGKKLFVLGRGYLVVCLDDAITMDLVNGIGALKDELAPEDGMRVVFKDDGFKDDVVKTNALQTLKRFGIEDIKSL
jgi:adenine-specific DNA-methyltransferase